MLPFCAAVTADSITFVSARSRAELQIQDGGKPLVPPAEAALVSRASRLFALLVAENFSDSQNELSSLIYIFSESVNHQV